MSTTVAPAIVIVPISKYRALMNVAAVELGWKLTQVETNVDQYRKGTETITLSWGSTQLNGFSHTKGKNLVDLIEGAKAGKLQRAQTALGRPMDVKAKWPKLSAAKVAELEALAKATFVVVPKVEEA